MSVGRNGSKRRSFWILSTTMPSTVPCLFSTHPDSMRRGVVCSFQGLLLNNLIFRSEPGLTSIGNYRVFRGEFRSVCILSRTPPHSSTDLHCGGKGLQAPRDRLRVCHAHQRSYHRCRLEFRASTYDAARQSRRCDEFSRFDT